MGQQDGKMVGVGVGVLLLQDGKILLGRRHVDPRKAGSKLRGEGTWTMPGGKLEFGESFEGAARRETLEETGIRLEGTKVICINEDRDDRAHFITVGLFSDTFVGDPRVMEPDTIVEWRWFDPDDLPSPMYFPSTRLLENYRQGKFYIPR